jgi:uncharacterized protein (DUF1800 family)
MLEGTAAVVHMLERLTFGVRTDDFERVADMGTEAWLDQQLDPATIDDAAFEAVVPDDPVPPASFESMEEARRFGREVVNTITTAKLLGTVTSERQLETVLLDFWFNHFNVFAGKGLVGYLLPDYERLTIRPHVLGRFRTLLGAVAKSPAMLIYLDNWLNVAPGAFADRDGRQRGLNENYARELLELHTMGGDGGYTQDDVIAVARAFTGWTVDRSTYKFQFVDRFHDNGPKLVLGVPLVGGGVEEGEQVLDLLALHPATATHLAFKLARRFISDEPPADLVASLAYRFLETEGDLRAVVQALVSNSAFHDPAIRKRKFKTPLELVAGLHRVTGQAMRNSRHVTGTLRQLGMPTYYCLAPTGFADEAAVWLSPGALVTRMNLVLQFGGYQRSLATIGQPEFQYR